MINSHGGGGGGGDGIGRIVVRTAYEWHPDFAKPKIRVSRAKEPFKGSGRT